MTRPGFFEGVAVAALASTTAGLLHVVFALAFDAATADRLLVLVLGGGYVFYLLYRTQEPAGRLTTALLWLCLATVLWLSGPANSTYLGGHLLALWLIRALYFQGGPLGAALDGLLLLAGTLLAAGAYLWSGSLFAAVWTFFLIQALFPRITQRDDRQHAPSPGDDTTGFETAYRSAAAALARLSAQHHHFQ